MQLLKRLIFNGLCRFYNIVLRGHIAKSLPFVFIYLLHHHRLDKNRRIHKYGFQLSRCNIDRSIGLRKSPGTIGPVLSHGATESLWSKRTHPDASWWSSSIYFKGPCSLNRLCALCFCFEIFPLLSARFWLDVTFTGLFSDIPSCRDDTSAAFTHKLIKGDFMTFRLCENQRSVHCFLGEHGPLSLRSYSFGVIMYSWKSSAYLHKI